VEFHSLRGKDADDLTRQLSALDAKDGWSVVAIVPEGSDVRAYLARELRAAPPPPPEPETERQAIIRQALDEQKRGGDDPLG